MLAAHQFNSVRNVPPRTKRDMVAALGVAPVKARLAGRNTLDYTDADGVRRIRLHETDILTLRPDGGFVVDTGGWNTHTTRDRLNVFLPADYYVFTERGRIHLRHKGEAVAFERTVTVTGAGVIVPDVDGAELSALAKKIDKFMAAWSKRGLPTPEESGGDPWVFAGKNGRGFGVDAAGKVDREIMLDWVEGEYVTLKLYELACRWAGVSDYGRALYAQQAWRAGGKLDKFLLSRIRRYVRACVGLAA